jgi:hypothetical protein
MASNNINDYGVNKAVENLPALRKAMSAINDPISACSRTSWRPLLIGASCENLLNQQSPRPESASVKADARLQTQRRSQLDRLYQRVVDDLDTLVRAVGRKAA